MYLKSNMRYIYIYIYIYMNICEKNIIFLIKDFFQLLFFVGIKLYEIIIPI